MNLNLLVLKHVATNNVLDLYTKNAWNGKNVHEACETFKAAKADLEKATFVVAMKSKVNTAITTIQSKIDIAQRELKKEGPFDPKQRIQLQKRSKFIKNELKSSTA